MRDTFYSCFLRIIFFAVIALCAACNPVKTSELSPNSTQWASTKTVDRHSQTTSCVLESSPKHFTTGAGLDRVKILVKENDHVVLTSDQDPFDKKALEQIGVKVDEHSPVLRPNPSTNGRELWFTTKDSAQLLDQFKKGETARIQVAISPRNELLTGVYSLRGFEQALLSYRMCEVVKAEQTAARDAELE